MCITYTCLASLPSSLLHTFTQPSYGILWYLLYFLTLISTTGITWTVHLWLGSTVVAGIAGWLLSYLLVPPALPAEQKT